MADSLCVHVLKSRNDLPCEKVSTDSFVETLVFLNIVKQIEFAKLKSDQLMGLGGRVPKHSDHVRMLAASVEAVDFILEPFIVLLSNVLYGNKGLIVVCNGIQLRSFIDL